MLLFNALSLFHLLFHLLFSEFFASPPQFIVGLEYNCLFEQIKNKFHSQMAKISLPN